MSHFSSDVSQFVACTVKARAFSHTLVSVRLRHTAHFDGKSMSALYQQLRGSLIICGDFSAHHPSFGSARNNFRGSALPEAVYSTDLILMNDGRVMCFGHQEAPSMLDLTLVFPDVECSCSLDADTRGSD